MSLLIVMAFWRTLSISPSTLPSSFPSFLPYFKNKYSAPKIEKSFFVAPAFLISLKVKNLSFWKQLGC